MPKTSHAEKAQMVFCNEICTRDPECTAFQFSSKTNESGPKCQIMNGIQYTGDGAEGHMCFVRKATVSTGGLKMVKHNAFCSAAHEISRYNDDLHSCADRVLEEDKCGSGNNVFYHRKHD